MLYRTIVPAALLSIAGCSAGVESELPVVGVVHAVTLASDDFSTSADVPDELVPHMVEIEARFERGELVADGPLGDDAWVYLYDADRIVPQLILEEDPAVRDQLLEPVGQDDWVLYFEAFQTSLRGRQAFIIDYAPGEEYEYDEEFFEQDGAEHHLEFYSANYIAGAIWAGGTIGADRARYILLADSEEEARDLAEADRMVRKRTVTVSVAPWGPPSHRRSLSDERPVR
ncbi:MAG: hypothetical protein AAGF12_13895 [Myxococcota bacterium]